MAQGYKDIKGTNTIYFIYVSQIPKGHKATYLRVVSAMRKVDYPYDVSTKTADLTTDKLLINSTLSMPNAKLLVTDLRPPWNTTNTCG